MSETVLPEVPQLFAEWTDDCQGKKDYDARLVSLSTRYWPRGGSFMVFERTGDHVEQIIDESRMRRIKPSAHAAIHLNHKDRDGEDWADYTILASAEFEAETQEDVQRHVEVWAREQFARIVELMRGFKESSTLADIDVEMSDG